MHYNITAIYCKFVIQDIIIKFYCTKPQQFLQCCKTLNTKSIAATSHCIHSGIFVKIEAGLNIPLS